MAHDQCRGSIWQIFQLFLLLGWRALLTGPAIQQFQHQIGCIKQPTSKTSVWKVDSTKIRICRPLNRVRAAGGWLDGH
ncbi:hypothetical protein EDD17DRAFT_1641087, partial [Pisolithus thermaeus]